MSFMDDKMRSEKPWMWSFWELGKSQVRTFGLQSGPDLPPCYRRVAGEQEVMGMAIPFRRRRPRDAPTQSARGARRNTPSTASEWGPPGSSAGPPVATRATATRLTRGSITELTVIGRWKQDGGDRAGVPSSRGNIRCERHGEKKQKSCFRR